MKKSEQNGLILCVAEKHGVDGETVRSGIREAIRAAQQSESSAARAFWDTVPADASDLDVVRLITALLCVG
ncbi:MAG: hypothetical protein ACI4GO_05855 [Hominenteromicrobium sp.]